MNKRGLSGVVTVIIIIALTLLAVGIIWFAVRPVLQESLGGSKNNLACIDVDLTVEKVTCGTDKTIVQVSRGNDEQEISKINAKFYNEEGSKILSLPSIGGGYIGPAETVSFEFGSTEIILGGDVFTPTEVSVFATLIDENEEEFQCEESTKVETNCQADICGDGIIGYTEQCDDGNNNNYDGCSSTCKDEGVLECGDGNVNPGETCDDGDTITETCGDGERNSGSFCSSDCNTELTLTEECDYGDTIDGDGCHSDCTWEDGPVIERFLIWDSYGNSHIPGTYLGSGQTLFIDLEAISNPVNSRLITMYEIDIIKPTSGTEYCYVELKEGEETLDTYDSETETGSCSFTLAIQETGTSTINVRIEDEKGEMSTATYTYTSGDK